ncbi:MAG TPA: Gldg family protein [Methylomirabilota bacterium]|nr:Gldg family protein [Methylomirabilota bacterium]
MSLLKQHGAWTGVLCLLLAGIAWLFGDLLPRADTYATTFLLVRGALALAGAVLVVAGLALNWRETRDVMGRRSTRYGAGAAVLVLLALGVVVFANALSYRHGTRWDLTENKRYTLSPQTIQVLKSLKEPVEAIAFFRSDTPGKRDAENLLGQYTAYSGGTFTWRLEDTDKAPALAREYNVDTYGTIVLRRGSRTEKALDPEEEKLTNALVKVTRAGKRVVYAVKGHGEREIGATDRLGLSQARDELVKANYEVKELLLARDPKIPDDAAVVVVPGPKTDLFPHELAALDAYIARGGKVLFMVSPFQAEALTKHLTQYGVVLGDDVVIELSPIGQLFGTGPLVPIVSQYEPHPITKDLGGVMTLFPLTRSVDAVKTPPKGVTVQALARTSPQSWGETDRNVFQKGTATPDPGEKRGPLPVAEVVTVDPEAQLKPEGRGKSDKPEEKKPAKARVVVLGTVDVASNQFLSAQGNRDFFLNVVSWLAEEEDLVSVRPKDTRQSPVILTPAQSTLVLWLPLAILPGVVAACGIGVVIRRRRSN